MALPRVLQPPPWLSPVHRRSWRILAWTNLILGVGVLLWVPLLWSENQPAAAAAYLPTSLAAAAALALLARGRWRLCARLTVTYMFVFVVCNAVWLNPVVAGVPRSAHQYLLALGVASTLMTRGDRAWVRYGFPALCLAVYAGLAGSHFTLHPGPSVDSVVYRWGAWFDQAVVVAVVLLVLHVLQTDSVRLEDRADELRLAIAHDQLQLHYQPQVDGQGRVTGAEALLRWTHPQRGPVSPAEFVPMAERNGLIGALGDWVLRRACWQLSQWADDPWLRPLVLSVNVSARQFDQADFVPRLMALLQQHRVAPQRLKIELTESALAEDLDAVIRKMAALRAQGVSLSLDDFGTGYSSLTLLRRLPLDQLKIDQSFVRDMLAGPEGEAIPRAIVTMGLSLGMEVIAEGVETEAHRTALARIGCHRYQGFLFARPMSAEALRDWVHAGPGLPEGPPGQKTVARSAAGQPAPATPAA